MAKRYPYWIYAEGIFVAWAIVLLLAWGLISTDRFQIFCGGFLVGVLGASTARKVFK